MKKLIKSMRLLTPLISFILMAGSSKAQLNWMSYTPTTGDSLQDFIVVDKHDNVWTISKDNDLLKFDGTAWSSIPLPLSGISMITGLIADTVNDKIWIDALPVGSNFSKHLIYDGNTWSYCNSTTTGVSYADSISIFSIDMHGDKWFRYGTKLVRYNGSQMVIYPYMELGGQTGTALGSINKQTGEMMAMKANDFTSTDSLFMFNSTSFMYYGLTLDNILPQDLAGFSIISVIVDALGDTYGTRSGWFNKDTLIIHESGGNHSSYNLGFTGTQQSGSTIVGIDNSNYKWIMAMNDSIHLYVVNYSGGTANIIGFNQSIIPPLGTPRASGHEASNMVVDSKNNRWTLAYPTWSTVSKPGIQYKTQLIKFYGDPFGTTRINETLSFVNNLNIYPNPFSSSATVTYTLNEAGKVNLELYDILGNKIEKLNEENQQAGNHTFTFSSDITPGIYFIKLTTKQSVGTKQIVRVN